MHPPMEIIAAAFKAPVDFRLLALTSRVEGLPVFIREALPETISIEFNARLQHMSAIRIGGESLFCVCEFGPTDSFNIVIPYSAILGLLFYFVPPEDPPKQDSDELEKPTLRLVK